MHFARLLFFLLSCLLPLNAAAHFYFHAGPEAFHFSRIRSGGTRQNGEIDGVRLGIDRIKPFGWYAGTDYLWASGKLKGETGSQEPLRSRLTDRIFELRFGFTLSQERFRCSFFTPFGGWGSFCEVNDFTPPSPLHCRFTDTFNYVVVGFLSGVNFHSLLSMGVNFKVKFMLDGRSKVSHDPFFNNVTLLMGNETLYRLDIPITYKPCHSLFGMDFLLAPFFEFRHFGGREDFPFNFRDTKFYLYGARLALIYCL